ncbi:MAG: hypothetical protein QM747_04895 [Nocardioides sp.]
MSTPQAKACCSPGLRDAEDARPRWTDLQDFDFYEIHEAFAAQVLWTLNAWEDEAFCEEKLGRDKPLGSIDRSKLNVNGCSLAAATRSPRPAAGLSPASPRNWTRGGRVVA